MGRITLVKPTNTAAALKEFSILPSDISSKIIKQKTYNEYSIKITVNL